MSETTAPEDGMKELLATQQPGNDMGGTCPEFGRLITLVGMTDYEAADKAVVLEVGDMLTGEELEMVLRRNGFFENPSQWMTLQEIEDIARTHRQVHRPKRLKRSCGRACRPHARADRTQQDARQRHDAAADC